MFCCTLFYVINFKREKEEYLSLCFCSKLIQWLDQNLCIFSSVKIKRRGQKSIIRTKNNLKPCDCHLQGWCIMLIEYVVKLIIIIICSFIKYRRQEMLLNENVFIDNLTASEIKNSLQMESCWHQLYVYISWICKVRWRLLKQSILGYLYFPLRKKLPFVCFLCNLNGYMYQIFNKLFNCLKCYYLCMTVWLTV